MGRCIVCGDCYISPCCGRGCNNDICDFCKISCKNDDCSVFWCSKKCTSICEICNDVECLDCQEEYHK